MSIDFAQKKAPARDRVLDLMRDLRWHPWSELKDVGGIRFGARLLELRRLGYRVETRDLDGEGDGKEYRLLSVDPGAPQEKRVKVFLTEKQAKQVVEYGVLSIDAQVAVKEALTSFLENKDKL